jgi:hypothetical protein
MNRFIIPAIPLALLINPVYYPSQDRSPRAACGDIIQTIEQESNRKKPAVRTINFFTQGGAPMIKHVVMWKLKDFAEEADKARNAKRIKIELEALKNTIPQIFHLEVGINFLESDAAYDVVLFSVFKNEKDLELYQNHPDHRAVAEFIGKVKEDRAVVDYKTL